MRIMLMEVIVSDVIVMIMMMRVNGGVERAVESDSDGGNGDGGKGGQWCLW